MGDKTEQTLVIIKPDAVANDRWLAIIDFYRARGLRVARSAILPRMTKAQARTFYSTHRGQPFFEKLVSFMASGTIIALILEGRCAINQVRKLNGAAMVEDAAPGTVRQLFGEKGRHNAVHASDSPESFKRESALIFGER